MKNPWWFGYIPKMRCTGPEYGFMSSLKLNLNGSRRVRICAFKDLEFYLLSQKPADSAVTLQEVNECLSEVATVV